MRAILIVLAALILALTLQISLNYSVLGYTIEALFPGIFLQEETPAQQTTTNITLELRPSEISSQVPGEVIAIASSGPTYLRMFSLEIYNGSGWFTGNLTLYARYFKSLLITYSAYSNEPQEFEIEVVFYKNFKVNSFYLVPLPQPAIIPISIFDIESNATVYVNPNHDIFLSKTPLTKAVYMGTFDNPYPYSSTPLIMGNTNVSYIVNRLKPAMSRWYNLTTYSSSPKVKELARKIYNETANKSLKELLDYIKKYLDENTEYSKVSGKPPKNRDFVGYFLFESRRGSCIAYSSAAALLLREIGIPARVVIGFVGEKLSDGQIVFRSSGHAWVELYIPDAGWIPYDPTPTVGIEHSEFEETIENVFSQLDFEHAKVGPDRIVLTPRNPIKQPSLERLKRLEELSSEKEISVEKKASTFNINEIGYIIIVSTSAIMLSYKDISTYLLKIMKPRRKNIFRDYIEKLARNLKLSIESYETPRESILKIKTRLHDSEISNALDKALKIYEEISFGGKHWLEKKLRDIVETLKMR